MLNPISGVPHFLNIYDYKDLDSLISEISQLKHTGGWKIASEPLLNKMPTLDGIREFLLYSSSKILMSRN